MTLENTIHKLQNGQGFASLKLVDEYLATGKLPAIHNDIGTLMCAIPMDRRRGALDLGACHGLLSVRAAITGFSPVIGLDRDQRSVDVFNQYVRPVLRRPDVRLERFGLVVREPTCLHNLVQVIKDNRVNTIIARRVLPELFTETYGADGMVEAIWRDAAAKFSKAVFDAGIEYIVVEGRKWKGYRNLTNPLFKVSNEIAALGGNWQVTHSFKECALLERAA